MKHSTCKVKKHIIVKNNFYRKIFNEKPFKANYLDGVINNITFAIRENNYQIF